MEMNPEVDRPGYESQVDTLLTIHAAQRDFLTETDMLERASEMLVRYRDDAIYHASLIKTQQIMTGHEVLEIISIRFGERYVDHNGNEHIMSQYIRVAEIYNGAVYAYESFDQDEAMGAVYFMNDLESLREQGVLPDLDGSLNFIREPSKDGRPSLY